MSLFDLDKINEYNYYVECLEDIEMELSKTTDLERIRYLGIELTRIRNILSDLDEDFI